MLLDKHYIIKNEEIDFVNISIFICIHRNNEQ